MIKMRYILGVDTSCYTTSLVLLDLDENCVLANIQIPLEVPQGEVGLRQSHGVFQHIKNLPRGVDKLNLKQERGKKKFKDNIKSICVSNKPRPILDSYMPVFITGESYAEFLGNFLEIPVYKVSHQEGHIAAGLYDNRQDIPFKQLSDFLVFHVSGGTTEILKCRTNKYLTSFDIEIIGGTEDISAGQLIDRASRELGLPFPGGPHLEELAESVGDNPPDFPVSTEGTKINFSGPETHIKSVISQKKLPPSDIARGVEKCIAESIVRALIESLKICKQTKYVLFVGGVMSNNYIKNFVKKSIVKHLQGITLWCTCPTLSKDNAVGVAWLGKNFFLHS